MQTAPAGDLDLAVIRARGTRLRRRRHALIGGATSVSVALVVGAVFAVSQPSLGPQPAGQVDSPTSTAATATPEQPSSELPFDVTAVQQLADVYGMRVDHAEEITPGVLDIALIDNEYAITFVATVADASTPADGQSELEAMTGDRGYVSIMIDGGEAFRFDTAAGDESTDYAVLSDDGMRIVSLSIVSADGESASDAIPDGFLSLAEEDLLPLLISI
ncbi:hypothetical protein SAMN04488554_2548 [Ruania alba]|uniref:Uncharacterized protein n=2 Tax=Ruania alba TaxID=648782 RepID=A0A1H5L0K7_9MICO|nr:hypothetical protein SAMN04488554_2548 [Ruania alba]